MRFALDGAQRREATEKGRGFCPICGGHVIAKCGVKRIWHWAHSVKARCDHWWENETAWHRNWKMNFPDAWQEVVVKVKNGEIHRVDVRTPSGLSIEFQHSPLSELEREEREEFYSSMVWVLDGSHGSPGYGNLLENIQFWKGRGDSANQIGAKFNPSLARITKRWLTARRPVLIDFGGSTLWSISTRRDGWAKYALEIQKNDFVRSIHEDADPVVYLSPWP